MMRRPSAFAKVERLERVVKRPSSSINIRLLSLNRGAVHGYRRKDGSACRTVEQRQAARSETPTEAERDLGHPDSVATREARPRTRVVQPCYRQQVTRLRSGWPARPRCG